MTDAEFLRRWFELIMRLALRHAITASEAEELMGDAVRAVRPS